MSQHLSNPYAAPLRLELQSSALMRAYLLLVHGMALLALWLPLVIPVVVKLGIGGAVLLSLGHHWLKQSILPALLIWDTTQEWHIVGLNGSVRYARLGAGTLVSSFIVVLSLYLEEGGRKIIVIFPDMLEDHLFRRLRIRLRQIRLNGQDE